MYKSADNFKRFKPWSNRHSIIPEGSSDSVMALFITNESVLCPVSAPNTILRHFVNSV